ncbi:hypothetical protein AB6A40_002518 [Gnathostoma spinigerum]|uniref:N-acetyltransferase domain-containing protein n=1 Tax=Gnathostoma spinigerum TaxID=75299 RepID=A0ABD6E6T7_9BILA
MIINSNTKIVGNAIILVPYEKKHVAKYHSWMENEELRRLTASERLSLEEEYRMQKSWREDDDKCTFIILSRSLLDEGHDEIDSMIGDVNVFLYEDCAELEVMVADKKWRRRGVAREAICLMLTYCNTWLHIETFRVKIVDDNIASITLFEKLGFEKESYCPVFKEHTLFLYPKGVSKIVENCDLIIEPYR